MNLKDLLDACGFNNVLNTLNRDRYEGMFIRQLKEKLDEYKQSEMNLLDWDVKKRRQAISISKNLECLKLKAKKKEECLDKYSLDEFLKDIDEINSELDVIYKKYDYSKLPK